MKAEVPSKFLPLHFLRTRADRNLGQRPPFLQRSLISGADNGDNEAVTLQDNHADVPDEFEHRLEQEIAHMVRWFCPREADARRVTQEALGQAKAALGGYAHRTMSSRQITRVLFQLIHAQVNP